MKKRLRKTVIGKTIAVMMAATLAFSNISYAEPLMDTGETAAQYSSPEDESAEETGSAQEGINDNFVIDEDTAEEEESLPADTSEDSEEEPESVDALKDENPEEGVSEPESPDELPDNGEISEEEKETVTEISSDPLIDEETAQDTEAALQEETEQIETEAEESSAEAPVSDEAVPDLDAFPIDDPLGAAKNGWVNENGGWRYYVDGTYLTDVWVENGEGFSFVGHDGFMLTNELIEDGSDYFYVNADGLAVGNTWVAIEDDSPDVEYRWYYFGADGAAYKNTFRIKIDDNYYGFDKEGRGLYGFVDDSMNELNTEPDAVLRSTRYYGAVDDGVLHTGWLLYQDELETYIDSDIPYYVFYYDANGKKATGSGWTIDGIRYDFYNDGLLKPALATPKMKSVDAADSGVQVSWGSVSGATDYAVLRKDAGSDSFKILGYTTGTSYVDETAVVGNRYTYSVMCDTADGSNMLFSRYDSAGLSIYYNITNKIAAVEMTEDGVRITWGAADGVESWDIYRKEGNGSWELLGNTPGTFFVDDTEALRKKYTYAVRGGGEAFSEDSSLDQEYTVTEFRDMLDSSKYYYKPVYWAVGKGITNGFSNNTDGPNHFRPQYNCTRAQMVTFLWREAGKPAPKTTKNPFPDVDPKAYYYKAVLWAAEKGITKGYSDGTFRPDETCLREHAVTFLYRLAGKPAVKTTKNPFKDIAKNDYYYTPALWAYENGIAKGYGSGSNQTYGPKLDCLREHIVTFLYRYDQKY